MRSSYETNRTHLSIRSYLSLHHIRQSLQRLLSAIKNGGYVAQLVRSTGIYALASFVLPLVTLVLAPFLTHTLSRNDYGVLAVLSTAITLMTGLTQFGLNNAFFRAYNYDYETEKDKQAVLSTVSLLLAFSSIPITLLIILIAPQLTLLLFNSTAYTDPIRLAALVVLAQNLSVPGFSWLRAENKAVSYAALAIINLLVNLCATIVLVGFLRMGMVGALIAMAAGYAVVVISTLPLALWRAGLTLRLDITRNLLSFGLPLVSNLVSLWILQLSDRYLLSRLGSLSQTASYTVAYSLGGILGVVVLSPFSLAWPTAMYAIAKREDAAHVFRQVFRWYSIFLLFATFALVLISIGILYLFFPPTYFSALPVIPVVALSIMGYGLYSYFTVGISIRRKTWLAVVLTTLAALVNVGLNLFLIPLYASIGAALSTLVAYALLAIVGYAVNQSLYPIPFEIGRFGTGLLIGLGLFSGCLLLIPSQHILSLYSLLISIAALFLYGCILLVIGLRPIRQVRQAFPQLQEDALL